MTAQNDTEFSYWEGCLAQAKKALESAEEVKDPYLRNIWVEIAQSWQQLARHGRPHRL